jgi:hypothetical protein
MDWFQELGPGSCVRLCVSLKVVMPLCHTDFTIWGQWTRAGVLRHLASGFLLFLTCFLCPALDQHSYGRIEEMCFPLAGGKSRFGVLLVSGEVLRMEPLLPIWTQCSRTTGEGNQAPWWWSFLCYAVAHDLREGCARGTWEVTVTLT